MAHFIAFFPGVIQTTTGKYKSIKSKEVALEPSRNVFVAIIEEMSRYCEGDEGCIGSLQAAMGMDYLGLYTDEGEQDDKKVKTFTKAIHALLASKTPPWFVKGSDVEPYYTELQGIVEYLENRKQ